MNKAKCFRKQNTSECSIYPREVMDVLQPGKYQSGAELNNSNIWFIYVFKINNISSISAMCVSARLSMDVTCKFTYCCACNLAQRMKLNTHSVIV